MKNLFLTLALGLCALAVSTEASAQAGGITKGNLKCGYSWPDSISTSQTVLFPTYSASEVDYAATLAFDAETFYQKVVVDTTTGNMTVNVSLAPELTEGALLYVYTVSTGSSRTITWGTNIDGAAIAQDSAKAVMHTFVFDGTKYLQIGRTLLN
jgi:hypothetical protein